MKYSGRDSRKGPCEKGFSNEGGTTQVNCSGAWTQGQACSPNPCPSPASDCNCDGVVNMADVDPFVLAMLNQAAYAAQFPNCPLAHRDVNGDGVCNGADIGAMVARLSGP